MAIATGARFPFRAGKFYAALREGLIAFAERFLKLSAADKDGFSLRDKLEGLIERARDAKARERYEAELECPPFPAAMAHVWDAFLRLRRRRGSNGFGPNPISWPDIDAFMRRTGTRLIPSEIDVIEALDDIDRAAIAENMKANNG